MDERDAKLCSEKKCCKMRGKRGKNVIMENIKAL